MKILFLAVFKCIQSERVHVELDPWRHGPLEEALADEVDHADVDHGEVGQQEGGHRLQGAAFVNSEWMNIELRFEDAAISWIANCCERGLSGK